MVTRRRFLAGLLPLAAFLTGGIAYVGYRKGTCPLSSDGYCVGPCSAFIDGGDGLCQRLPALAPLSDAVAPAPVTAPTVQPAETARPPATQAPSAGQATPALTTAQPTVPALPTATKAAPSATTIQRTACPFGLVNDPYPGRCRRYTDLNGNGYCDYSQTPA